MCTEFKIDQSMSVTPGPLHSVVLQMTVHRRYQKCPGRPLMIGTVALRFNTGNTMEERCSFATHISNITRNTNSFIHDSFGLHSSKEQEIRILSYGIHFIEYRKFQTIEMHSEHMMLNMIRSGIKDSQSTLIIFSKSWYTNFVHSILLLSVIYHSKKVQSSQGTLDKQYSSSPRFRNRYLMFRVYAFGRSQHYKFLQIRLFLHCTVRRFQDIRVVSYGVDFIPCKKSLTITLHSQNLFASSIAQT